MLPLTLTVMVRLGLTVSGGTPLAALMVKVNVPVLVGVPDSTPLVALSVALTAGRAAAKDTVT